MGGAERQATPSTSGAGCGAQANDIQARLIRPKERDLLLQIEPTGQRRLQECSVRGAARAETGVSVRNTPGEIVAPGRIFPQGCESGDDSARTSFRSRLDDRNLWRATAIILCVLLWMSRLLGFCCHSARTLVYINFAVIRAWVKMILPAAPLGSLRLSAVTQRYGSVRVSKNGTGIPLSIRLLTCFTLQTPWPDSLLVEESRPTCRDGHLAARCALR